MTRESEVLVARLRRESDKISRKLYVKRQKDNEVVNTVIVGPHNTVEAIRNALLLCIDTQEYFIEEGEIR